MDLSIRKPVLIRPELQALIIREVRGQKLRTRSPDTFRSTTARLIEFVAQRISRG